MGAQGRERERRDVELFEAPLEELSVALGVVEMPQSLKLSASNSKTQSLCIHHYSNIKTL